MTGAPTHRMTGTPLFNVWRGMLTRCTNPRRAGYKNYGGRGIAVCDRWLKFENFHTDMSATYRPGLLIERKDNDLGYSPDNCEWAPRIAQNRNRRDARVWAFKSEPISTSSTGIRGAYWSKQRNKWFAQIMINRRQVNLGFFDTKEAAGEAYRLAAERRRLDGNNSGSVN